MHIASKVRLNFNITTLTFDDRFPYTELSSVMTEEEFSKIVYRINEEIAHDLHENAKDIRRWFKIVGITSIFLVGIFLLPILLHKSRRQTKLLGEFQEKVTQYLHRLNKKRFLKRNVEWKLVKDQIVKRHPDTVSFRSHRRGKRSAGSDIINPATQLKLEIIYESDTSRLFNERISILKTRHQGASPGSTTSYTGINTFSVPCSDTEAISIPDTEHNNTLIPSPPEQGQKETPAHKESDQASPNVRNMSILEEKHHIVKELMISASKKTRRDKA